MFQVLKDVLTATLLFFALFTLGLAMTYGLLGFYAIMQ